MDMTMPQMPVQQPMQSNPNALQNLLMLHALQAQQGGAQRLPPPVSMPSPDPIRNDPIANALMSPIPGGGQ